MTEHIAWINSPVQKVEQTLQVSPVSGNRLETQYVQLKKFQQLCKSPAAGNTLDY